MNGLLGFPAASMGGDTFVLAAKRVGLGADIGTLNKIVDLVNQGMSPDQAAEMIAFGGNGNMKMTDVLNNVINQKIQTKLQTPMFSGLLGR
jgi:hypothetical protein